jgi:hypothetical protein
MTYTTKQINAHHYVVAELLDNGIEKPVAHYIYNLNSHEFNIKFEPFMLAGGLTVGDLDFWAQNLRSHNQRNR